MQIFNKVLISRIWISIFVKNKKNTKPNEIRHQKFGKKSAKVNIQTQRDSLEGKGFTCMQLTGTQFTKNDVEHRSWTLPTVAPKQTKLENKYILKKNLY